jgi:hypothetical protein
MRRGCFRLWIVMSALWITLVSLSPYGTAEVIE